MWLACFLLLCGVFLGTMWWRGPNYALGCAVGLSLLIPAWLKWDAGPLPIDLRTAIAVFGIAVFCLHPAARVPLRLTAADWALLALMFVNVVSDGYNDGFSWLLPLRVYGEWGIPYVAARLAVQTPADARKLAPILCLVVAVLAVWGLTEAIGHTNPANAVFGERPDDFTLKHTLRFGLQRAEGPTRHSIYLGMLIVLLAPWVAYQTQRAWRHEAWGAWLAAPGFVLAGLIASTARSPIFALLLAGAAVLWWYATGWRRSIGVAYAGALLLIVVCWKPAVAFVEKLEGGKPDPRRITVVVDQQRVAYSGTKHRLYLWPIYAQALRKAGAFGYGTYLTSSFPLKIPMNSDDPTTRDAMKFVDNHYILTQLRLGYLGLACFVAFVLAVVVQTGLLVARSSGPDLVLTAALGGAFLGVSIMLLVVWLPYDFGFLYLWTAGATSGLLIGSRSASARGKNGAPREPSRAADPRSPSHRAAPSHA